MPTFFIWFFVLFGVLFAFAVVRGIVFSIRRRQILRDAGLSPMMAEVQVEARLANSMMLSPDPGLQAPSEQAPGTPAEPAPTAEQKLADLQQLFDCGVILADELREARLKVISS